MAPRNPRKRPASALAAGSWAQEALAIDNGDVLDDNRTDDILECDDHEAGEEGAGEDEAETEEAADAAQTQTPADSSAGSRAALDSSTCTRAQKYVSP